DLGGEIEAYQEVARRLGVLPSADIRDLGRSGAKARKRRG
ncbi:MAG: phosphoribosylaminoimidazolesuccinocarboxamide synthase, partial [Rhodothalassiaceae bacterium]